MLNICESCGRHSSQTVFDVTTQHELCPWCHDDLMKQLAVQHEKESKNLEYPRWAA